MPASTITTVPRSRRSVLDTLRFVTGHPLTRGRPLRALGRYAHWQLQSRLCGEVVVDWISGARLAVRTGMTGATGNIYCGLHEFADMAFLLHLLRPGDLFLDVGANVGSYTVLASKVCGAKTVAFEPDGAAAERLRQNIQLNDIEDLARVCQFVVGAETGEVAFTVGLDTTNHVTQGAAGPVRTAAVRRLDDTPGCGAPTMIKLDVEGYEEQVIAGAYSTLAAPSLLAIETELQSPEVERALLGLGFRRAYYDPFRRILTDEPGEVRASNGLYLRNPGEVLARVRVAPVRSVVGVRL
ncbi:MAG: FkbM family methyltransferase [Caulobacteraceae bacterium]|nr:FkbM family methyltransferase [Caulobacteraceae bacterium]